MCVSESMHDTACHCKYCCVTILSNATVGEVFTGYIKLEQEIMSTGHLQLFVITHR